MTRIRCGTTGFGHDEWIGHFYPEDLPASERLRWYAGRLPTVELNNTFYRAPRAPLLERWAAEVPGDFVFAMKAPQSITYMRRLRGCDKPVADLLGVTAGLGRRLGPLLFVLPPSGFGRDVGRLAAFLALLPRERRVAFELRDPTWLGDDVFEALRAHGAALCLTEGEPWAPPLVATARWGYLRLRLPDYGDDALAAWAERLQAQGWDDAFVYFRHGEEGRGARLALKLAALTSDR